MGARVVITLGSTVFASRRFVAPDPIRALRQSPYGLVALTRRGVVLFDEDGAVRAELALDHPLYSARLAGAGEFLALGPVDGELGILRVSESGLHDLRFVDLGVSEDESYNAALAATERAVHVGLSDRRMMVDWQGAITERAEGPLEGPENVVGVAPDGSAVVWGNQEQVVVVAHGERRELPGGACHESPFAFDGQRLAVARAARRRLTVTVFDGDAPVREMSYLGISEVSALTFVGRMLVVASERQVLAFDLDAGTLAWADRTHGPSGALAVCNGELLVARGHRVVRRDPVTGARLDGHEGPANPLQQLVRVDELVLLRDGFRVYQLQEGQVVAEHDAWSAHADRGRAYLLMRRGVLARFEQRAVYGLGHLRVGSGGATIIDLRDREALMPDPNEREPPRLRSITGEDRGPVGQRPGVSAYFLGDDAFLLRQRVTDEHRKRTQYLTVLGRDGDERWSRVVEDRDFGVMGVDARGRAFVLRREGEALLVGADGTERGSFGGVPKYIDVPAVLFSEKFVLLVHPEGRVLRLPIDGGEVEEVHRFDEPVSAAWADARGQGLVAFGAHAVVEADFAAALAVAETAPAGFDLGSILASDDGALAERLRTVSFRAFDPARHLAPMVERLTALEMGAAHRALAERLVERGARVTHRHAHESRVLAFALSPDGQHFATGSWIGDDYERGGQLQVWSVETGHVTKVFDAIPGGVGWPGYGPCLQWSPDGREIGAAIDTNGVANYPAFGEATVARTVAYTTDGWSRPPSFAWMRSGRGLAIASWSQRSFLPACLVEAGAGAVGDQDARFFAPAPPSGLVHRGQPFAAFQDAASDLCFSEDDRYLFCANRHGEAWTVDLPSGQMTMVAEVEWPLDWGRSVGDPRWLLHAGGGGTLLDAVTGAEVQVGLTGAKPEHVRFAPGGARALVYADGRLRVFGRSARGLTPEDELATDLGTAADRYEFRDAALLTWCPAGERIALMRRTGEVVVWTPGEPRALRVLAVGDDLAGLLWRGETLAVVGKSAVEFFDAAPDGTFERRHRVDLSCKHELLPDVPSPLEVEGDDCGAGLRPSPTVPRSDGAWGLVFPDGVVVNMADETDGLAFVVDARHELPVAWALRSFSRVAASAAHLPLPEDARARLAALSDRRGEDRLPLGETASLGDVSDAHWDLVKDFRAGWHGHVDEALTLFATLLASKGDVERAAQNARRTRSPGAKIVARAEVAWRVAKASPRVARTLFDEAEAELASLAEGRGFVTPSVALAAHALGNEARRDVLLAEADVEAWLQQEVNPFERRCGLARAYLRVDRERDADRVLDAGPWETGSLRRGLERYLVEAARDGWLDHALRWAATSRERVGDRGINFTVIEAFTVALCQAERYADARAFLDAQHGYSVTPFLRRVDAASGEPRAGTPPMTLERALEETWPPALAAAMRDLAQRGCGADAISSLLRRLLEVMPAKRLSRSQVRDLAESLGEALGAAGLAGTTGGLDAAFSRPADRLALRCGVARGAPEAVDVDALVALTLEAKPRQRVTGLVRLAAALRSGAPRAEEEVVAKALAIASELRGDDRRFALADLTEGRLAAGDLEGAYIAWRKQARGTRSYEVRPLVEALARAGELAACLHVLRGLTRKDDMNGLAQELRVAGEVFVHGVVCW